MVREVTVAAAQLGPYAESKEAMVKRMVALMEEAAGKGVEILIYPELALTPYFATEVIDDAARWFEQEMPSPLTRPIWDVATRAGITFCLPYAEACGDTPFNSSAVVLPNGEVAGKYRKTHIPGFTEPQPGRTFTGLEKRYFVDGDLPFPVYDTPKAKLGVLICYDRRFPEAYRSYQLAGAELVLIGYNTGTRERALDFTMMQHELVIRANAYQHGLWVVASGKAGIEDGTPYIGGSCVVSPEGEIIAKLKSAGDDLVVATIDLDMGKKIEQASRFLYNRRTDLYRLAQEEAHELVAGD